MVKFYLRLTIVSLLLAFPVVMASTQSTAPGQPGNLRVTAANVSGGSFTLEWDPVPGATGYYVYQDTPRTTNGERISTRSPITASSFEVERIVVNTDRSFWVKAYNDAGEGPSSIVVDINLHNTQLKAPANLKVTATNVSGSSFTLVWDPVPGATGYYVYEGIRNRLPPVLFSWDRKGTMRAITTSETEVQRVTTNRNTTYRVTAYNDAGEGPPSEHFEFNLERK